LTNSSLINVSEERTDAFDGGDEGGAGGYVDDFLVGRIGVGGGDRRVEDGAFLDAGGWSKRSVETCVEYGESTLWQGGQLQILIPSILHRVCGRHRLREYECGWSDYWLLVRRELLRRRRVSNARPRQLPCTLLRWLFQGCTCQRAACPKLKSQGKWSIRT